MDVVQLERLSQREEMLGSIIPRERVADQRDLSVSHNKIGDVLVAQGDGPGALAAYRKGLAIAEALRVRAVAHLDAIERPADSVLSLHRLRCVAPSRGFTMRQWTCATGPLG